MDGLMNKCLLLLFLLFPSTNSLAKVRDTIVNVLYLKNIFGHIHLHPANNSETLTTVACGHPIKVFKKAPAIEGKKIFMGADWNYVKVGIHLGFIKKDILVTQRPKCFQDEYPKFFDSFDLNISELYYWGRLYDHYIRGRSRVK